MPIVLVGHSWGGMAVTQAGDDPVAVQRSDFRGVLASGGGEALEASLQRKTSDLSRGSIA